MRQVTLIKDEETRDSLYVSGMPILKRARRLSSEETDSVGTFILSIYRVLYLVYVSLRPSLCLHLPQNPLPESALAGDLENWGVNP